MEINLQDNKSVLVKTVLPEGAEEGFLLVRKVEPGESVAEPFMARAVVVELMDGKTVRLVVKREKPDYAGSFEQAVARAIVSVNAVDPGGLVVKSSDGKPRYVLLKDVAGLVGRNINVKSISDVCRDSFGMDVFRTGDGWALMLDKERVVRMAQKYLLA